MGSNLQQKGYSLVLTIILSTVVLAVLTSIFGAVSALYKISLTDYYLKLAQEAGESGTSYANACLDKYNRQQTWGSVTGGRGKLTPSSSCMGEDGVVSSNKFVLQSDGLRSTFEVGDLDYSEDNTAQISAIGRVEVLSSDNRVIKTYTATVKKTVTWPTNFVSQKSVSGSFRTCALLTQGVYCWGRNKHGQLGNGKSVVGETLGGDSIYDSDVPVKVLQEYGVLAGKNITDIYTGHSHTCVVADKRVYCWGNNTYGQLGDGNGGSSSSHSNRPVRVGGVLTDQDVVAVGGASFTSCAITNLGKVYCWGSNEKGVLGADSSLSYSKNPIPIASGQRIVSGSIKRYALEDNYRADGFSTSGSQFYAMCIISSGKLYCWGDLSFRNQVHYRSPTLIGGAISGKTVTTASLDGYGAYGWSGEYERYGHICAVADSEVYCWGINTQYEVGYTGSNYINNPRKVVMPSAISGQKIIDVKAGARHNCLLTENKQVYCWGGNTAGQLGVDNKSLSMSATPLPVKKAATTGDSGLPKDVGVLNINGGANRGCATIADGRTFCWGLNTNGQIGDATKENRFLPTESLFLRPTQNRYIY